MTSTTEPSSFHAGDNLVWTKSLADYPASTWTLHYSLVNAAATYTFAATADGDTHSINVPTSATTGWAVGRYGWQSYVTDGTNQHTIASGVWDVKLNPATASAQDMRTHAEKMVDAIESHLEGKATAGQLALIKSAIGDRDSAWKPEYLIPLRDKYRAEIFTEQGGGAVSNVQLHFR